MAIVQTQVTIGDREFISTQSDAGKYIEQVSTGQKYQSAMDLATNAQAYIELDELIPVPEPPEGSLEEQLATVQSELFLLTGGDEYVE